MLEGNTKGANLVVTYERWHTTTYIGVGCNAEFSKMTFGRLIGYGILVFWIGEFGAIWIEFLSPIKLIGFAMTSYGIYVWFKTKRFADEFRYENEDVLTYFWNKIVLKLWTFILYTWMCFSILFWAVGGILK
ncbi:MAG: hypothetical protein ABJH04_21315 [Cyclobacteriaceae bacterium]